MRWLLEFKYQLYFMKKTTLELHNTQPLYIELLEIVFYVYCFYAQNYTATIHRSLELYCFYI